MNEFPNCPVCGDPIDYCQGHGQICCEHCGEPLDGNNAEIFTPSHPEKDSIIVHAEPCATHLFKNGYEIA
jgi:hypothetical protein